MPPFRKPRMAPLLADPQRACQLGVARLTKDLIADQDDRDSALGAMAGLDVS